MSTAIQQYDAGALTQWHNPEEVLAQAQKAALALKKVLDLKANKVMFNGEQYLEREDWGTAGRFFGCTAKSTETRYVEFPDGSGGVVRGFEAVAVVIDMNTMHEIGRAESMCLDEEENWGDVPKYEWQDVLDEKGEKIWDKNLRNGKGGYKTKKVLVGSTPKPLFQLRSMAQTRAEAKALKSVFGWFVVLAGYKPTPAEEMTGHEFDNQPEPKAQVTQPSRASSRESRTEADTRTQTTTSATGGNPPAATEQHPQGEEVSGIIESVKSGKEGILWLTAGKSLVMVPEAKVDSDMKPGYYLKAKAVKKHSDKVGDYFILGALIELSPVQDGTVAPEPAKEQVPLADDAAKIGEELFGEKPSAGQAEVKKMVENGTLKPASALPEKAATKPGTIGAKKQIRLDSLCTTNKKNNHGFNHDEMRKILAALPVPVEHIRDMEENMLPQFEKWCTGEEDWNDFWKE